MFRQIKRIWQLGRLAHDMTRVGARHRLANRVQRMHGLPEKIGQLLDLAQMVGPADDSPRVESRDPIAFDEALRLIEKSLGRKWTSCFRSIDATPITASLGQVHRAVLVDGRAAAVKIQYPQSAEDVATDLRALGWLTASVRSRRGFDRAAYQHEIGQMLHRELDYQREARSLQEFNTLASGWQEVVVPELIGDLSTERILTMSWIEGESFDGVRGWPVEQRRQAGSILLRLFLRSLFAGRRVHADPHPGNYLFQRTAQGVRVALLDFGCVQSVEESWSRTLAGLIEAARAGTSSPTTMYQILAGYVAHGFSPELLQPMAHLLPALNQILFEPFVTPGPFDVAGWRLSERVEEVLGSFRWNFRFAGPAKMIFVVRAYLGLLRYLHALDVALDWSRIWQEVQGSLVATGGSPVEDTGEPPVTTARTGEPPVVTGGTGEPPVATVGSANEPLSRHLRVRVREGGATRVDITFNAVLAECLDELLPPEIEEKLRSRRLDIRRIAAEAAAGQFAPGELFTLVEGSKQVRVWLE